MLRAALKYAEAGWPVFPIKPQGKRPLTPHGFKDATTDCAQIEQWWSEHPDANVGVPTGAATGTVVLDVDGPEAEEELHELGASVPTLTSVTAKGRHIFFKHPGRPVRNRGRLREELDVRADGGYVVVPPSIHASGHCYHWDDQHGLGWGLTLAPLPARVLEALTQNGTSDRPVLQPSDAMIPVGDRNNALTRLAGAMRRQGATPAEIESALNNANQHRCVSPLAETEVKQIATSIGNYPAHAPHTDHHGSTVVKRLSDVEPEPVEWLWHGRVPLGKITVLDGDPGTGKTTLMLDVAARVTTSRAMPGGSPSIAGGVLVLTAEDGLADTIRPRLDAMGADPTKVFAMAIQGADGFEVGVTLPEDIARMRQVVTDYDIVLVIVDPLSGFLSEAVDSHKDSPIRRALAPLAQLAEETGVAIVCIRHLNKSMNGKALYRGGGSIAIAAAARSVLLAAEDPEDPTRRVLAGVKNNLAPPQPSLAYHLEADPDGASCVIWDGESKHTANLLCTQPGDPDERSAQQEIADLLRDLLEIPRTVKEIRKAVRNAGHEVSDKTLQRARRRIGANATRFEYGGDYVWSLAGPLPDTPEGVSTKEPEADARPAKTPALLAGHSLLDKGPVSTNGEPPTVPDSVRIQAKEYAIGHPDCSPDDVIRHLGLGVPLLVANAATDELAGSEDRFAMLRREVT